MKPSAIYPGTFDPMTLGHLDIVRRASEVFDRLVVAVAETPRKQPWFSLEERIAMVAEATSDLPGVEITSFHGLLVDFARAQGIRALVRGLRAFSDFEYEFQMALSNRKLAPDIETVFLMTSDTFSYISSSVVKEITSLGGNTVDLVPPCVQTMLSEKHKRQDREATES